MSGIECCCMYDYMNHQFLMWYMYGAGCNLMYYDECLIWTLYEGRECRIWAINVNSLVYYEGRNVIV